MQLRSSAAPFVPKLLQQDADQAAEQHICVVEGGCSPSTTPTARRRVLKADTSWRKWHEETSWCTGAWDSSAANWGCYHQAPGSKHTSKSPDRSGQHGRNRGKRVNGKRRQQWIVKTSESQVADDHASSAKGKWSRTELAEKRRGKSALWGGAVHKDGQLPKENSAQTANNTNKVKITSNASDASGSNNGAKAEPQLFSLTADDSDDDEADFFPGEARQLDDPPLLDQAADEPGVAGLDAAPFPQFVATALDVPLAPDKNAPPLPECMKLDLVSTPMAAA